MLLPVVALSAVLGTVVDGAEMLAVLPIPVKSHHGFFQPILRGLAQRGHKVTYITPIPLKPPHPNIKVIQLPDVMDRISQQFETSKNEGLAGLARYFVDNPCNILIREPCQPNLGEMLKLPALQDIIKDTKSKYDLILLETTFAQEAYATLAHKFGAPIVELMPTSNMHWSYYLHGVPYDTSYINDLDVSYSDRMDLKQRLVNTVLSLMNRLLNSHYYIPKAQEMADTYVRYPGWEGRPPLLDIVRGCTSLYLINTHVSVNYPYPMPPNAKLVGGLNIQNTTKPLPNDIKAFMDGATDGVIYFTLGSHIDASTTLGNNIRDQFTRAFANIKQRVLWKWEKDNIPNLTKNVKISKWFPQQDILSHKNMKLFISHGGLLSTTEAVANGLPLVGIPILGDQPKNINHVKVNGYGVHLDLNNLTQTSIGWAINEILSNPRYVQAAKRQQMIFRDKPQSSLETAMFWIEYVLRHDGAHHLKPAVASMPWYQQALVDVYLTIALIFLIPLLTVYFLIKTVCTCLCRSGRPTTTKYKKQ